MKRSVSDVDAVQRSRCHRGMKRRKTRHVNAETGCTSPPPSNPSNSSNSASQLSHASLQPFILTEKALENTQQALPGEHAPSLQHWLENCPADSDHDMMAAPPTPRSASVSSSRGRRASKHSARASRNPVLASDRRRKRTVHRTCRTLKSSLTT
jgi:hypothetical protein